MLSPRPLLQEIRGWFRAEADKIAGTSSQGQEDRCTATGLIPTLCIAFSPGFLETRRSSNHQKEHWLMTIASLSCRAFMRVLLLFQLVCLVVVIIEAKPMKTGVSKSAFGKTADGRAVDIFTLTNVKGAEARITN